MKTAGGDSLAALGNVEDIRESRPDLDNQLLASLDHYFTARIVTEWGVPAIAVDIANSFYSGMKFLGISVPTDTAAPASPISMLQWQAGVWGANDGSFGVTGGHAPPLTGLSSPINRLEAGLLH
jgi:hypothetical protein